MAAPAFPLASPLAFPFSFAKDHGLVPLSLPEDHSAGMVPLGLKGDAPSLSVLAEVRRALGVPFTLTPLEGAAFERRLSEVYAAAGLEAEGLTDDLEPDGESLSDLAGELPQAADLLDTDNDAPVIRLINGIIAEAVRQKASDVHVEPFETRLSVRLRVDGVLQEVLELPPRTASVLVSRLKVMARLDIAEKRLPQDGRISLTLGGRAIDVRVSTLPAKNGERVVLRLLDREDNRFDLPGLGMNDRTLARFKAALKEPNGIILVTGPTGSGKTTTLYAGLAHLNDASRNILTVEDPIEYTLEGIGQTQVNPKVGLTFAAGLRAILRQDPDVVLVGEIRDYETAEIAVQASLTGHLVLSTVHTNDAVSAITRLKDMKVEPFLLASTVKAILAQRLLRRLCPECKAPMDIGHGSQGLLWVSPDETDGPVELFQPVGCPACKHTGYQGRIGIYELVIVTDQIKRMIHDDAREADIADIAFKEADTLAQSGFKLVAAGETSVEEVLRVCRRDTFTDTGVQEGGA